jgi:penicillin-binding protein A
MSLERRALNLARFFAGVMVLLSLPVVYWQLVRGLDLAPVVLDPVRAVEVYDLVEPTPTAEVPGEEDPLEEVVEVEIIENIESLPQPVIQRTAEFLATIGRGSIYDRNGRLLAADLPQGQGRRVRFYWEPSLAHTIGYVSGLRTGVSGLEQRYNSTLLGLERLDAQVDQLLHRPVVGSDLVLTIDSAVQRSAENALGGRAGAVLVLDAGSGAILAMASAPRFDPNRILEPGYLPELVEACDGSTQCRAPLLNRASQARYIPGSTWKLLPLIAGLDSGQLTPGMVFDFGEPRQGPSGPYFVYEVDGGIIPDPNHRERRLDLEMSLARSANAAFARIGDEMPPERMIEYAARFGFGRPGEIRYPFDFEFSPAQLANDLESLHTSNLLRAATAIGQGELLTSPVNLSLVILGVLNEGRYPLPYLVHAVVDPSGRVDQRLPNRQWVRNTMSRETARTVEAMMVAVVERGTGQRARIPGLTVGGKTGTAQLADQPPHAWFAGFARNEERGVVVVVLVEHGGEGSRAAGPIFAEVAAAAMFRAGEAVEEFFPPPPTAPGIAE